MNALIRIVAAFVLTFSYHGTSSGQPAAAVLPRILVPQAAQLTIAESFAASELAATLNANRNSAAMAASIFGLNPSDTLNFDHCAALILEAKRRDALGTGMQDPFWSEIIKGVPKNIQSPMQRAAHRAKFTMLLVGAVQKAGGSAQMQSEVIHSLRSKSVAWALLGEGSFQYVARWNDKPRHPIGILALAELIIAAGAYEDFPSDDTAALEAGLTRLQREYFRNETRTETRGRLFAAFRSQGSTNFIWRLPYEEWNQPTSKAVLVMPLAINGIFLGGQRRLSSSPKTATLFARVSSLPKLVQRGWLAPIDDVELNLLRQTPAQITTQIHSPAIKAGLQTASTQQAWIWFENAQEFGRALASAQGPPGGEGSNGGNPQSPEAIAKGGDGCDVEVCISKKDASATVTCEGYGVTFSTSGEVSVSLGDGPKLTIPVTK